MKWLPLNAKEGTLGRSVAVRKKAGSSQEWEARMLQDLFWGAETVGDDDDAGLGFTEVIDESLQEGTVGG